MAEQERGSDDAQLGAIARHALHDEELVAAFAAGDVEDKADADRARSFVERCATCRDLHRDLTAIRLAVQASGTAAQRAATVAAPRDFRLSAEDAARLRPASPIARIGARLGLRARLGLGIVAFGRPVGAAMATLGVAGLLIGSLALAGSPIAGLAGSPAGASVGPAASSAPGVEQNPPAPETTTNRANYGPLATADDTKAGDNVAGGRDAAPPATLALIGGSIGLLVVGFGLIVASRRNPAPVRAREGN